MQPPELLLVPAEDETSSSSAQKPPSTPAVRYRDADPTKNKVLPLLVATSLAVHGYRPSRLVGCHDNGFRLGREARIFLALATGRHATVSHGMANRRGDNDSVPAE
ncbi:hypothetical protein E4U42_003443 [Claviceps africana]|uniref:Uncharacterized protein n=1 Tax=Claviceps africana TaxID=83212 RepID=A0A8K0NHT4_9HYPO|nr:hypothetical protein E4U42_003443 [Claviceps africana]